MTIDIDLNDYSGGPHWLSAKGKVNREAIRAKHRAKYLKGTNGYAERGPEGRKVWRRSRKRQKSVAASEIGNGFLCDLPWTFVKGPSNKGENQAALRIVYEETGYQPVLSRPWEIMMALPQRRPSS